MVIIPWFTKKLDVTLSLSKGDIYCVLRDNHQIYKQIWFGIYFYFYIAKPPNPLTERSLSEFDLKAPVKEGWGGFTKIIFYLKIWLNA